MKTPNQTNKKPTLFQKNVRRMLWQFLEGISDEELNKIVVSARHARRDDAGRNRFKTPSLATRKSSSFRVLLANPPWRSNDRLGVRAGSRWPFTMAAKANECIPHYVPFPFYLAYAAAVLERAGINVVLIDAIAEGLSLDDFLERVQAIDPDLAVLETSTPSIHVDLETAWYINFFLGKRCRIALTGPHTTAYHESLIKHNSFIDFALRGEYEGSLTELVQVLKNQGELSKVSGMTFRKTNGEICVNPERPIEKDLDRLPWPAYRHLPMYNYNDDFNTLPIPNVQIWASRGCPYQCSFCAWPQTMYASRIYRVRNPADVADEMDFLVREYGFKGVYFDDDTFNIGSDRILSLCDEIKRRGLQKVPWAVMARADNSDAKTLAAMADAGMVGIKFGVESSSQAIVDACGKGLKLSKVEEAVATCKKLGLKVHLTFTFGLPGETNETIAKTIDYALALDPHSAQFSLATPFPGTRFFKEAIASGNLLTNDWQMFDGSRYTVIKTDQLSKEDLESALSNALHTWEAHIRERDQTQLPSKPIEARCTEGNPSNPDELRKKLKTFYTNYRQYYVTNSYYQILRQSTNYSFYDYLAGQVTPDMEVLDVGSSSGVLTMEIARLSKKAYGIDVSPAAQSFSSSLKEIEYKRHRLIEKTLGQDFCAKKIREVEFVQGSAERLPYDEDRFDLIFSTDVLEHIVNPKQALAEMVRCVRPNGHIIVQVIKPDEINIDLSIEHWTSDCGNMSDRDAVSQVNVDEFVAWCDELCLTYNMFEHNASMIFAHLRKTEDI